MLLRVKIITNILVSINAIISASIYFLWPYPLELLSHFRLYYFLFSLGVILALLVARKWKIKWNFSLYLSLTILALNSTFIIPWYWTNSQLPDLKTFRLLEFNINIDNNHWDEIAASVLAQNPDVTALIEITPQAMTELKTRLNPKFPFSYRTTGGGLAIFSRFPLISPQSKKLAGSTILVTQLSLGEQTIELIVTHPLVPIKPDLFQKRNALLTAISDYVQSQPQKTFLLVGDFNLTPWSPYYKRLMNKTKLHNTRQGFGVEPSWIEEATHIHLPVIITRLVKIPIDHILVSPSVRVHNCKTYKAANSDHRILISDLSF